MSVYLDYMMAKEARREEALAYLMEKDAVAGRVGNWAKSTWSKAKGAWNKSNSGTTPAPKSLGEDIGAFAQRNMERARGWAQQNPWAAGGIAAGGGAVVSGGAGYYAGRGRRQNSQQKPMMLPPAR